MRIKIKKEYIYSTWKKALKDKLFLFLNIINLLIVIGLFAALYYMFGFSKQESVVLHYNIYFGIDLIGGWYRVFNLAYVGLAIFLFNLLIGGFVYLREKVLTIFLALGSFICLSFLSLASFLIIYLNS